MTRESSTFPLFDGHQRLPLPGGMNEALQRLAATKILLIGFDPQLVGSLGVATVPGKETARGRNHAAIHVRGVAADNVMASRRDAERVGFCFIYVNIVGTRHFLQFTLALLIVYLIDGDADLARCGFPLEVDQRQFGVDLFLQVLVRIDADAGQELSREKQRLGPGGEFLALSRFSNSIKPRSARKFVSLNLAMGMPSVYLPFASSLSLLSASGPSLPGRGRARNRNVPAHSL